MFIYGYKLSLNCIKLKIELN